MKLQQMKRSDGPLLFQFTEQIRQEGKAPWYSHIDVDYYEKCLTEGVVIGRYDNHNDHELTAYALLSFPSSDEMNYASWLNIPEEEQAICAIMDGCIVHPRYRGKGIQQQMLKAREDKAIELGYIHAYISIHPDNKTSRLNAEAAGYTMELQRNKYKNTPRCFYYKKLK